MASISSSITVKELLEKYPCAIHVFLDSGLLCPGCPVEAFHTLDDVAEVYKLDLEQILRRIQQAVADGNCIKEIEMNEQFDTLKATPFNLEESIDYSEGAVVSKTLIKKDIGNITLFAFDSGQGLSEHTAPFDAVVQILDGIADISIDGSTSTVKSGEMLIMPANIPHALHAKERFKMLLIMIRGQ
jgi:hybrid cluster-associated redox disulfide protein